MIENDLREVVEILRNEGHTCVIKTEKLLLVSDKRGIAPIMEWLTNQYQLKNAVVADKIVGKATALLYVLAGITAIHADVISERALSILDKYQVITQYDKLVPFIINRQGNGQCPMESAVESIDDPNDAYAILKRKLVDINDFIN